MSDDPGRLSAWSSDKEEGRELEDIGKNPSKVHEVARGRQSEIQEDDWAQAQRSGIFAVST